MVFPVQRGCLGSCRSPIIPLSHKEAEMATDLQRQRARHRGASTGPFAYVTNNGSSTVSVLDTASNTVVATPSLDGAPLRVAVTADGKRAYIASRGDDGIVSVLDTVTNTVAATVPGVTDFFIAGLAITPDGKHAYVASSGNDHTVKVLDTATNKVAATVPLQDSIDIAITPDGKHAYVTNFEGVSVIDTTNNTVETTIPIGKGSTLTTGRGVAISRDGKKAYLTNGGFKTVSAIDTATNTVSAHDRCGS
jgi:YVTN family beta-propeller protein